MNASRGLVQIAVTLLLSVAAHAEFEPDPAVRVEVRAAKAIERIKTRVERSRPYFDDAYAIAVWPGIGRFAIGFGGAYGKGVVIEQGEAVGTVSYWQISSGIQAGLKSFAMVVFFKDKAALESLERGEWQFVGQAGIDVATRGVHGTPAYHEGVAIIPMTRLGLMGEFAAAGVKYNYRAYSR